MSFYTETTSGDRVWVSATAIKINRATCTSNPHQPQRKWYITARPKDTTAYAAGKVSTGEWSI